MHITIAGGSGFIGQALTKFLLAKHHQITIISRNTSKLDKIFGKTTRNLSWESFLEQPQVWLSATDWVINLAGANIGAHRWNASRKEKIITSRIETAGFIARAIANLGNQAPVLFNASGIGIYGTQVNYQETISYRENSPIDYKSGSSFLAQVSKAWERSVWPARDAGARVVFMRFGAVLARHGGALPKIAQPILMGFGGRVGHGKQPFAWITLDDLLNAVWFAYQKQLSGPINFVAPEVISQIQLAKTLAKVFKRPSIMRIPSFALKLMLGEVADELILHGQNVTPEVLLKTGFKFEYPTIEQAINHIYRKS